MISTGHNQSRPSHFYVLAHPARYRRKSFGGKGLGQAWPTGKAVSPLVPTTYDYSEKLLKICGILWREVLTNADNYNIMENMNNKQEETKMLGTLQTGCGRIVWGPDNKVVIRATGEVLEDFNLPMWRTADHAEKLKTFEVLVVRFLGMEK